MLLISQAILRTGEGGEVEEIRGLEDRSAKSGAGNISVTRICKVKLADGRQQGTVVQCGLGFSLKTLLNQWHSAVFSKPRSSAMTVQGSCGGAGSSPHPYNRGSGAAVPLRFSILPAARCGGEVLLDRLDSVPPGLFLNLRTWRTGLTAFVDLLRSRHRVRRDQKALLNPDDTPPGRAT